MEHFEFDPLKSRLNKELHGVDLEWAESLWDVTHAIVPAKNVRGESRYFILAKIGAKCYAAASIEELLRFGGSDIRSYFPDLVAKLRDKPTG